MHMIILFNYLLILHIFLGAFVIFDSPFEFYGGYIFIIIFMIMYILHYHNISINSTFFNILIVLIIFSLVNVLHDNTSISLIAKQVLGILLTGTAYYLLIKINKYNIDKLFIIYLRIALIVAVVGIFQEFSYLIDFEQGYNYHSFLLNKWKFTPTEWGMLRLNSIFFEPSQYATTMAPAFFVALSSITGINTHYLNKYNSMLVILSYILTFSSIAFIVIMVSILIMFSNVRKNGFLSLAFIIIFSFVFVGYSYIPEIGKRFDDTLWVATGSMEMGTANLSTYAIASNAVVAYQSFIDNILFGSGLGSHPISYDKFVLSSFGGDISQGFGDEYIGVNKGDANSLLLRLASETGLFGVIAVLCFVIKYYLRKGYNSDLQVINNAILTLFIVSLVRQGHYFLNGLFFFVWLYYFAYRIDKRTHWGRQYTI